MGSIRRHASAVARAARADIDARLAPLRRLPRAAAFAASASGVQAIDLRLELGNQRRDPRRKGRAIIHTPRLGQSIDTIDRGNR